MCITGLWSPQSGVDVIDILKLNSFQDTLPNEYMYFVLMDDIDDALIDN